MTQPKLVREPTREVRSRVMDSRRWDGVVAAEDLALYDAKVKKMFSPTLARWCEQGRLAVGEPREAAD